MTYLEYLARIKSGNPAPKPEDAEYWLALNHKAEKVQCELTDEEQERKCQERRERTEKLIAELDARRIRKSNGINFETWENEFREHVSMMSGLCGSDVPVYVARCCYEQNEDANIAALNYVNEYDPPEPDPELEKQREQMNKTLSYLNCADEIHRQRVNNAMIGKKSFVGSLDN